MAILFSEILQIHQNLVVNIPDLFYDTLFWNSKSVPI